MDESCHTYKWVMSRIRMSHVTHMNYPCHRDNTLKRYGTYKNELCHTYQCVMWNIWLSHITYEGGLSHESMSHVPETTPWGVMSQRQHPEESCPRDNTLRSPDLSNCHTSEWVMSHFWMSHVTLLNESCHTYELPMSQRQHPEESGPIQLRYTSCHTISGTTKKREIFIYVYIKIYMFIYI